MINILTFRDGRASGSNKLESQRVGDIMLKNMNMLEVSLILAIKIPCFLLYKQCIFAYISEAFYGIRQKKDNLQ